MLGAAQHIGAEAAASELRQQSGELGLAQWGAGHCAILHVQESKMPEGSLLRRIVLLFPSGCLAVAAVGPLL